MFTRKKMVKKKNKKERMFALMWVYFWFELQDKYMLILKISQPRQVLQTVKILIDTHKVIIIYVIIIRKSMDNQSRKMRERIVLNYEQRYRIRNLRYKISENHIKAIRYEQLQSNSSDWNNMHGRLKHLLRSALF